jgi:hypothetical protein
VRNLLHQKLRVSSRLTVACGLIGWLILAGCSGGGLQPVPVRGTVQYKGHALTNGLVAFVPVDPAQGTAARGVIGGDGRFKLTTFEKGDGAFPGEYNVTVFSHEVAEDPYFFGVMPSVIPERYNQATTSGLVQTVPGKATVVELQLEE